LIAVVGRIIIKAFRRGGLSEAAAQLCCRGGPWGRRLLCRGGSGARRGGRLRIIDCDRVKPSDINRQLIALRTTIGLPKVQAAAERILAINPKLQLETCNAFFHFDTADGLISEGIDFVIDAIDSLSPKGQLIKHCTEKGTPLISALGASSRTDPFQLQLTSLNKTVNCPLARALRRHLRTKGIPDDVPVIYSPEPSRPSLLAAAEPLVESTGAYIRGRLCRSLPMSPTLPGIVGLMATNYVIFELQKRV